MSTITYRFRIKDSSKRELLKQWAGDVNYVWNYCNDAQIKAVSRYRAGGSKLRLSGFDLNKLTAGSSSILRIPSATIQVIGQEYATRLKQFNKVRLKWRSFKRKDLGWIPFKAASVRIDKDSFVFNKQTFRFWNSRGKIPKHGGGSIIEDSQGKWYLCVSVEVPKQEATGTGSVGVDLGTKTLATCSDGTVIENTRYGAKHADRLAKAQKANKKKLVTAIHAKIKNCRKDHIHKETTKLVRKYKQIFVGDVSSQKLVKTRMAKSVLDASWGMFKSTLSQKALRLGVEVKVVSEKYSTVTCSVCGGKAPFQSGLSSLGVRNWECQNCKAVHDRDVNAAVNILNFALGHQSPLGESPSFR